MSFLGFWGGWLVVGQFWEAIIDKNDGVDILFWFINFYLQLKAVQDNNSSARFWMTVISRQKVVFLSFKIMHYYSYIGQPLCAGPNMHVVCILHYSKQSILNKWSFKNDQGHRNFPGQISIFFRKKTTGLHARIIIHQSYI